MKSVKIGDRVLAVATGTPGELRCTADHCRVLIQRTVHGDLVDGVVAHYQMCHPERNVR